MVIALCLLPFHQAEVQKTIPFLFLYTWILNNPFDKGYKRSFTARDEYIKETVKRYKTEQTFEDFLITLYPLKGDDSWKAGRSSTDNKVAEEEDEKKIWRWRKNKTWRNT